MAIEHGYALFQQLFLDTNVFSQSWIVPLVITFLSLVIITRNTSQWKLLFFPILVGWAAAGLRPHFLLYVASAIFFAIEILSMRTVEQILKIGHRKATDVEGKRLFKQEVDRFRRQEKRTGIAAFRAKKTELTRPDLLTQKEFEKLKKMGLGK